MEVAYEPPCWSKKWLPRGRSWYGLRRQMNTISHSEITAWSLDAPQRILLARDLERCAPRFSGEILDISPIAVVVFRMRRHRYPHNVAGATHSHFDCEPRQVGWINAHCIGA